MHQAQYAYAGQRVAIQQLSGIVGAECLFQFTHDLRGAQGGPRLMGGQRERVRGQSRELLYSTPTALCEEIARAATAELADRLSIPD